MKTFLIAVYNGNVCETSRVEAETVHDAVLDVLDEVDVFTIISDVTFSNKAEVERDKETNRKTGYVNYSSMNKEEDYVFECAEWDDVLVQELTE